ncbi:CRISPR system precrRNA processing endoribonuclease RAMP protein Cas6 [Pseudogracilibacillus sp. SO30301A]|uniref:CRISPR system precrRNA processing endoribonuclease RAMP protein Cas6 n=1 Tax=Pseudogracilibacillus sp. SO30301A TaxID=3098291 RepID=UPI00300E3693
MFPYMKWITLRITFVAQDAGLLPPYLGSTVRGLIGHSFRQMVCSTPNVKCYNCSLATTCEYANYFVSPKNAAGSVNPFVLHVLTKDKTTWQKGDICEFDLTLLGVASEETSLIVQVLQQMEHLGWGAARIPFKLLKIIDSTTNQLIWCENKLWLKNAKPKQLICHDRETTFVFMQFPDPLRLQKSKRLITAPTFEDIIRAVTRRIALLSHAYAGYNLEWDDEDMLLEARKVRAVNQCWKQAKFKRFSMNQKNQSLEMDTITGSVCYQGNITPFTPLLEAGKLLHIGRNPTHGFGYYTIDYL